jgi:pyridoxal phosphate enzyme (YggS family)
MHYVHYQGDDIMSIAENISNVLKFIPENVKLIAVSKTKTIEEMKEAYDFGIRDFGENKVQEIQNKYSNFPSDVRWHLIGHLQRNKVKYIVDKVHLIHSLDSIDLLNEIEKQYGKKNAIAHVLIEINIGKEASKTGIFVEQLNNLINAVENCNNVKAEGLMTVIPKGTSEENKEYFKEMKIIFENLNNKQFKNIKMKYLSMGMTEDYKIAIEEGSNMVRIGTGIFGPRNYNNK